MEWFNHSLRRQDISNDFSILIYLKHFNITSFVEKMHFQFMCPSEGRGTSDLGYILVIVSYLWFPLARGSPEGLGEEFLCSR